MDIFPQTYRTFGILSSHKNAVWSWAFSVTDEVTVSNWVVQYKNKCFEITEARVLKKEHRCWFSYLCILQLKGRKSGLRPQTAIISSCLGLVTHNQISKYKIRRKLEQNGLSSAAVPSVWVWLSVPSQKSTFIPQSRCQSSQQIMSLSPSR